MKSRFETLARRLISLYRRWEKLVDENLSDYIPASCGLCIILFVTQEDFHVSLVLPGILLICWSLAIVQAKFTDLVVKIYSGQRFTGLMVRM